MHDLPNAVEVGVLVALISGVFSLVGLIIAKETKLSDFRQAWIDALREDISLFVSHAINISSYFQVVIKPINVTYTEAMISAAGDQQKIKQLYEEHQKKMEEFLRVLREDFSGLNVRSTRIKLRLNNSPHEIDAISLLREMKKMEIIFGDINNSEDKIVHGIVEEIEITSRPLLKKEWNRVKEGERTFKIAKLVSFVLSAILALFLLSIAVSAPAYLFGYLSASRRISEQPNSGVQGQISIRQQVEPSSCSPVQVAQPPNK
jgi:hypothetical protein